MPPRAAVLVSTMLLGLAFGPGCSGTSEDTQPEAAEPTPTERAETLKLELGAAHRDWSEGKREEAQERVRVAYTTQFEPLEPALRARDPLATLRLEYAFGHLQQTFGQPGNPVVVIEEVRTLNREVEAAVASLQVPEEPAQP